MTTTPLYASAFTFLQTHQGEHLAPDQYRLVTRCIDHLMTNASVSYKTAWTTSMQAYGDLISRRRREYIDCSRTTSYTLFLIDNTAKRTAYTLPELQQLIGQARRTSA